MRRKFVLPKGNWLEPVVPVFFSFEAVLAMINAIRQQFVLNSVSTPRRYFLL
jgi:hypothetical protein